MVLFFSRKFTYSMIISQEKRLLSWALVSHRSLRSVPSRKQHRSCHFDLASYPVSSSQIDWPIAKARHSFQVLSKLWHPIFKLSQYRVRPTVYAKARPKKLTKYSVIAKARRWTSQERSGDFTAVKVVAGESDRGKEVEHCPTLRNLLAIWG